MSMPARPWSMIVTRVLAVSITFGVGAASFALSFTALRDLATRGHVPDRTGMAMAADGRWCDLACYAWGRGHGRRAAVPRRSALLLDGARRRCAVSIACNALHAILPPIRP